MVSMRLGALKMALYFGQLAGRRQQAMQGVAACSCCQACPPMILWRPPPEAQPAVCGSVGSRPGAWVVTESRLGWVWAGSVQQLYIRQAGRPFAHGLWTLSQRLCPVGTCGASGTSHTHRQCRTG